MSRTPPRRGPYRVWDADRFVAEVPKQVKRDPILVVMLLGDTERISFNPRLRGRYTPDQIERLCATIKRELLERTQI